MNAKEINALETLTALSPFTKNAKEEVEKNQKEKVADTAREVMTGMGIIDN